MTPLELKTAFRVMQEELTALRDRVVALEKDKEMLDFFEKKKLESLLKEERKIDRKMCPKCGVKPAHYFHVRSCNG